MWRCQSVALHARDRVERRRRKAAVSRGELGWIRVSGVRSRGDGKKKIVERRGGKIREMSLLEEGEGQWWRRRR